MMKKSFCFLLLLTLASISLSAFGASIQKQLIDLNRGWQFRRAPDSALNHVAGVEPEVDSNTLQHVADWTPAEVPGCIQTDLLRNKIIAEPFYRDNEQKQQWIGKTDWDYQTSFTVTSETLKRENIELLRGEWLRLNRRG